MEFNSFCKVYGLDPEIAGQIPCPPIENEQIQIKMQMVNWCESMKQQLSSIERSFQAAPVDNDGYRLNLMRDCRDYMKQAMVCIERVIRTEHGDMDR